MDVMPNCAPMIIDLVSEGDEWPTTTRRRWRAKKDFNDESALTHHRAEKAAKADGQSVQTFIADEWTLEYDLALGPKDENGSLSDGLAEDVFVAACLADNDDAINSKRTELTDVVNVALQEFAELKLTAEAHDDCLAQEVIAANVYAKFAKDGVSKAIAAQYLAQRLETKRSAGALTREGLRERLPRYIRNAIDYVTAEAGAAVVEESTDE
jgi:putative ATP-dependent endonuclease of OLD family